MAVLFGLASALVYGAADFMGGLQTRRSGPLTVVVWSQLVGLLMLLAALLLLPAAVVAPADVAWGAAAGIGGGLGVTLLYRGLSIGRMSVVAPITAVGAAAIPVLVGTAFGERPSAAALLGVVVALLAIVLVSSVPEALAERQPLGWRRPGLAEAVGAGLAFAAFFICLDRAGDTAGLWPLLAARTSIGVALLAAVTTRTSLRPAPRSLLPIAAVGALDMAANLLYLLATRQGLLSIVAVLVSLYPASTVLLARIVLGERLARPQLAGLGAAAAGVALMAAG